MSDTNEKLIAKARTVPILSPGAYPLLIHRLADALESSEARAMQVNITATTQLVDGAPWDTTATETVIGALREMAHRVSQHDAGWLREAALRLEIIVSPYERPQDSEWVQPVMKGYLMKCCDCGLVHSLNFRIVGKKVQFQCARVSP